jgi:hypothetical protein
MKCKFSKKTSDVEKLKTNFINSIVFERVLVYRTY